MIAERLLVIGLGLIGGSLASAIRQSACCGTVLGSSRSADTVSKAMARGVVDRAATDPLSLVDELQAGDVVVIATPTLSVRTVLEQLRAAGQRGVIITDVASVKGSVVEDARAVYGEVPATFIPGHPIAGSEKSGIDAVNPQLFQRHEVILTPLPHSDRQAVDTVSALWRAAGANVSVMAVEEHDAVLSLTSHLPHMLAYTLVDTLAQRSQNNEIFRYAAGGFRDFTRIAGSDPTMWHDIAIANRDALLQGLADFEQHLADLRNAIRDRDGKHLYEVFSRAKQARDYFGELYARRKPDGH